MRLRVPSFRMPLRFLRGHYGRLALTVSALAFGVAQVLCDDLAGRQALQAFEDIIDTMAGRAALQVTAGEGGLFAEDLTKTVAQVPGVERTVPVVGSTAFMGDSSGELLAVQGLDITDDEVVSVYELSGEENALSDPKLLLPDAVVLTRAFADRRGFKLGDAFDIDTPNGRRRVHVWAFLDPQGMARLQGGNLMLMDLPNAQETFVRPGVINRLDVVVRRDADLDAVRKAVAAVLPAGLRVEAPQQRKADLQRVMHAFQMLLFALGLLGLGAAFLIAFSSMSTLFEGRAWQLGVLRAHGVRGGAVWLELLKESLLLGAMGVVLGVPLGLGISRVMSPAITATAALQSKVAAPTVHHRVYLASVLLAVGMGLGAALLAAALPAWRATRLGMVQTMRGRGVEQHVLGRSSQWAVRALFIPGIAAAIALQAWTDTAAWGLVATVLIAVAAALAARPLLAAARRPLLLWFRLVAGPSGEMAVKNLTQNTRRAGLTIAMLGVGLGCVLWLWMVGKSFEASVIDAVSGAMRADLVVSSAHIQSGFIEAPASDEIVEALKRIPGTAAVVGERIADWTYGGGPVAISATDPPYFTTPDFGQWPLVGRGDADMWPAVARGEAVVVSSSFVRNLHVHPGETLALEAPGGLLRVPIVGVVTQFSSPRGTIEMSRDLYRRYWLDRQVTRVYVRTTPGANIATVRTAIARDLGRAYNIRILTSAEIVDYFVSQVRQAFAWVYVIAAIVLSVVLIGMGDTLAAGVIERTREIGLIRVVGVRRHHVRRMVYAEALILGSFGLLLAGMAGWGLGWLWVDATLPALLGWVLKAHIPYGRAAGTLAVTLIVCLAAAVIPARRAAGIEPASALRYE